MKIVQNLLKILEERGYIREAESLVMSCLANEISNVSQNVNFNFTFEKQVSDDWFTALQKFGDASNDRINGIRKIISRIGVPKYFFYAKKDETIVGVALAIIERSHLGIYNMITDPKLRRQGIARSIIFEMKKLCQEIDVKNIYLQVQGDNLGAIELYKSVNLTETFRYRYLVKK